MSFKPWFIKEISIRLVDENTGFISTVRYGKIHLKPESVQMGRTTEGMPVTQDRETQKTNLMKFKGGYPTL